MELSVILKALGDPTRLSIYQQILSRIQTQLEKNHVVPTSSQDEALARYMVIFKIFRWFKTNKQTIRAPVPPASHPCFSSHPNLFLLTGMDVKLGMVTFGKKNLLNIFICYGPRYVLDTMCCA